MASDHPPKEPSKRREGRDQADRIAAIGHRISEIGPQISAPIRELIHQFIALIKQIQADNKTTDTREKEHQNRSFRWIRIGTNASIVLSVFSVGTSILALLILNYQLGTMRIEQRAWIKIEHKATSMEANKPLIVELTIKNIGKTPAKHIDGNFIVKTVKKNDSPDLRFIGLAFNVFSGILHPDGFIPAPVPMLKEKTDLLNPDLLTANEVAEIQAGEA